ncbi:MAG: OmpP1/FadL family transporter [Thermoanaerobaculia bacterium]
MRPFSRLLIAATATSLLVSGTAFAAGFGLYEQGAKGTAMAGAFAATADDPTAIFFNVAGIAQQRHFAISTGGTGITFANQFRGDPNDPFTSGQSGEYRHHVFLPVNAYAVIPIGTNLTAGIGLFTPFGLRTNWQDPWVGRFISRDANLKVVDVEPALAWQTSDGRFAVGAGADYRRSHITLNRNNAVTGSGTNPFNGRIVDVANAFLDSDWDTAWGYNAGFLYKPGTWRLGASYRSHIKIDYKGTAKFTQIPTGNPQLDAIVKAGLPPDQAINTSIDYPAIINAGIACNALPTWTFEFDATRTTWSRFKTLNIDFVQTPANNLVRPQNWEDSNSYRLGAQKAATDKWDVRFGVLLDRSPQPTEGVGPLLPDADREGLTFGVGYHNGPWIIDATEFVLHFKERGTQGRSLDNFNGTYKTDANLISINLGYKF